MSRKKLVIAIDGPAASGKSTTAKLVAERLGYLHVDTGAMYRAVTLKVINAGVRPDDVTKIRTLVKSTHVELAANHHVLRVLLDGADVTERIRSLEVTKAVSSVSSIAEVRRAMVREQRKMGETGGIVLEGRDIGTVVFPDADLKVFMVAGIEARALRRQAELHTGGIETDLAVLIEEIRERDRLDSSRSESPLRKAEDAIEVDTSSLTIQEQVEFVLNKAREIMRKAAS